MGNRIYSIPCRATSSFAPGRFECRMNSSFLHMILVQFILLFILSWCNSFFYSYYPGAIHPFLHIILVQFILFFILSWCNYILFYGAKYGPRNFRDRENSDLSCKNILHTMHWVILYEKLDILYYIIIYYISKITLWHHGVGLCSVMPTTYSTTTQLLLFSKIVQTFFRSCFSSKIQKVKSIQKSPGSLPLNV